MSNALVVVANWNDWERTVSFCREASTWVHPELLVDILIIDNGSTDGSPAKIMAGCHSLVGKIRMHRFAEHPGVTAAFNVAFQECGRDYKYIFRVDNDVHLRPDAISKMACVMDTDPGIGVTVPRLTYFSAPAVLNGGAMYINEYGGIGKNVDSPDTCDCDTGLGAALGFRVEALLSVGRWFDPDLMLFAEEPEICAALRCNGFRTAYVPSASGTHETAVGTGRHTALSTYLNYRNHEVVRRRYGSRMTTAIRFANVFPRLLVRSVRKSDWIGLLGYWDGLIGRKLHVSWWNEMIANKGFKRPPVG